MSETEKPVKGRIVAIVGRPNVGKSALFNRLAGRRIAIVHSESGVTRDRLMREITWEEERFELIDTGGLNSMDGEVVADLINSGIRAQVEAALQDAAVAILVVDIQAGLTPMDEEVAGLLRSSGVHVRVAANKADEPQHEVGRVEFDRLGFPVIPVSAMHDRGIGDLMDAVVPELPPATNVTIAKPLRVAVVGRPNVGKSSYINRLLNSDRVIVSDVPGTTRDSIDVPFTVGHGDQARHYVLIDTAGMRRVGKIDSSVERFSHFRSERSIRDADVVVLVIDGSQGPTAQEKRIAALIAEEGKGCVVVVNKWDLVETTQKQYAPEVLSAMPFLSHCPLAFTSAETGYNIRRSVDAIDLVASQIQAELPTGVLNRAIEAAYCRTDPPRRQGKSLRIYYAVQVGTSPLRVRLFVNDPRIVQPNYRAYLTKQLRAAFGLEGAPIFLHFRGRDRAEGDERKETGDAPRAEPARARPATGRTRAAPVAPRKAKASSAKRAASAPRKAKASSAKRAAGGAKKPAGRTQARPGRSGKRGR